MFSRKRPQLVFLVVLCILCVGLVNHGSSRFDASLLSFFRERTLENWTPAPGDKLVVDINSNTGYLIHKSGSFIRFPVITGQQRVVHYIGRTYYAQTPEDNWEVRTSEVKGDRVTYGPSGRFLRLFDDTGRTHYGIHEHRDENIMFARDNRYQSMGCIIVRTDIMDILAETFEKNDESLPVLTKKEVDLEDLG